MTHQELWSRIELAAECPPFKIEWGRTNGFCWLSPSGTFSGTIGVATAMVGHEPADKRWLDRTYRADLLGWEWHYLMHFETAIDMLYAGNTKAYNYTGLFPFVANPFLPFGLEWMRYGLLGKH